MRSSFSMALGPLLAAFVVTAVPAGAGKLSVRIDNVKAGRYALQAFHDGNSYGVPEAPPEGYAFGNDSPWPTTFQAATVAIAGSAKITVKMQYVPTGFGG